jgi:hypothetical protein
MVMLAVLPHFENYRKNKKSRNDKEKMIYVDFDMFRKNGLIIIYEHS